MQISLTNVFFQSYVEIIPHSNITFFTNFFLPNMGCKTISHKGAPLFQDETLVITNQAAICIDMIFVC